MPLKTTDLYVLLPRNPIIITFATNEVYLSVEEAEAQQTLHEDCHDSDIVTLDEGISEIRDREWTAAIKSQTS